MLPPAASASQSSSPSAFLYVLLYSQSEMEADVLAHEHSAHAEHLALLAARARALKRDNEEAAFRYQEVRRCTPRHSKSGGTVPVMCAAGWQLKSGGLLVAEYFFPRDFKRIVSHEIVRLTNKANTLPAGALKTRGLL